MKWDRYKIIITLLVILAFLCQNFAWAYGGDKLAPRSKVDDPKLEAAAAAYAEMLAEQGKPTDPDEDPPPSGSVLRSIIAFILIPILVFMWLTSPININTSYAQTQSAISQQADPQWFVDLKEVLRLEERNRGGLLYRGSVQYDSLRGALLSGGVVSASSWGVIGDVGLSNPLISYPDEGFGAVATGFLRAGDESWLSLRGGVLPDYTPDSTHFALVGIDTRYRLLQPYLHAGVIRRVLDGPYGNALGLLVDGGVRLNWEGLELDLRGSGPLYFRPVARTVEDYRRVMGDLSLLRARFLYNGPFWWVGGVGELGGLESRLDSTLPSNRFSRYGVDGGLRFDVGQVDLALALQGERLNPSFGESGAYLARPSLDITWRDLSLRGGVWVGPFVRPYGEIMYRLLRYIDLAVGYNGMPPIYHEGLFEGPFSPRDMVTFSFRGGTDTGASPRRSSHDEYPVQGPTGTAMRGFVYGPLETPVESAQDELERAMHTFERSLRGAVAGAKTAREAIDIFKRIGEQFDPGTEEQSIAFYTVWSTFWDAFYKNPNIDFYWMRAVRDNIQAEGDVYQTWHDNHYGYNDIVRRLLARVYEVPDANSLYLLISEFNLAMTTAGDNVDESVVIGLFENYRQRLREMRPGSPAFTWTYYVASRLFAVLVGRGVYPGVERLAELIEADLKIPAELARLNIDIVVPNDQIEGELLSNAPVWINADNPDTQIQGLLVLEYLVKKKGNTIITQDIFVRLDMILLAASVPELVPIVPEVAPSVPVAVTKESEQFKRLKAAIIALDILIRINMTPEKDVLKNIMDMYERLPADLKIELRLGEVSKLIKRREEQRGNIIPRNLTKYAGLSLPLFAGLILTGCSGSGIGTVFGMGILGLLAVVTFVMGPDLVTKPVISKEKPYKLTGDKVVDDFLDSIFKDRNKKTILVLDTDIGNLRDPAISLLATLERLSQHGQLGGITFIRAEGSKLREKVEKAVGEDKDVNIVLVCKNTNKERFNGLESAFITSVDDSNRVGTYIPILEILTLSLRMASKADIDEVKVLYKEITGEDLSEDVYAGKSLSLILPRSEPMDYESLRERYKSQKELLLSA